MSRKMNKMLRDAGCAGSLPNNILWFVLFLPIAKNAGSKGIFPAASAVLFVQIIPHGALIILLFDFQYYGAVCLPLLRKNPVPYAADIQPLPISCHLILYQTLCQHRVRILLQQEMQRLADACRLYSFHSSTPFQK